MDFIFLVKFHTSVASSLLMSLKSRAESETEIPKEYKSIESDLRNNLYNKIKNTKKLREKLRLINDEANGFYEWYSNKAGISLTHVRSMLIIFQDHLENLFPLIKSSLPQKLIDFWNGERYYTSEDYEKEEDNAYVFYGDVFGFVSHCHSYWDNDNWVRSENISSSICSTYNCPKIMNYFIKDIMEYDAIDGIEISYILETACKYGYLDNFKVIISNVINNEELMSDIMSVIDDGYYGCFNEACKSDNLELVKYIFDLCKEHTGSNPDIRNALENAKNLEIIKYLLEIEYNIALLHMIMYKAIKDNNLDVVQYLIEERGLKIDQGIITRAYRDGSNEVIEYIKGKVDVIVRKLDEELLGLKID